MKFYDSFRSLFIFNFIVLAHLIEVAKCKPYKAGVVEYFYNVVDKTNQKNILDDNLNELTRIIAEFKQNWRSDIEDGIIVFPEDGLTRSLNSTLIYIPVPDPDYDKNNFTDNKVLEIISNAAKTYKTWVVVNLLEASQEKKYNTDVVFRSNGTIAAKYRKYNLFGEKVDRPVTPDAVSFKTDFGVTFGIFTCFDILFSRPALDLVKQGIKHFIFPTAWYSELPFLSAIQYQMAWAWSNDVTVLASGLSYSKIGSTGSGIYQGKKGPVAYYQTHNSYKSELIAAILNTDDQATNEQIDFVIKDIKKINLEDNENQSEFNGDAKPRFNMLQEALSTYTTQLITHNDCKIAKELIPGHEADCIKQVKESVCNRELCCDFDLTAIFNLYICKDNSCQEIPDHLPTTAAPDDFSLSTHRLAVFNGVRSFYVANAGLQTCGVISCRDETADSCGLPPQIQKPTCFPMDGQSVCIIRRYIPEVKIKGVFEVKNAFVTPNVLLGERNVRSLEFGQLSNDFNMSQDENGNVKMSFKTFKENTPLSTVAIWNRVFDRDGQPLTVNSSTTSNSSSFTLINAFAVAFLLYPILVKLY